MDDLAKFNQERWEELAEANVRYSRPALDLTRKSARQMVDSRGVMGDPAGKDVLCLAGGGGQQSAAFALLGANVTVLDLSETQLRRDRQAAEHYGFAIRAVQGDMRDLSCFGDDSFDIVWHAHSLNFVPDARPVFDEVRRVIRPGGLYHLHYSNPFAQGIQDAEWDERGYPLRDPYVDGHEFTGDQMTWEVGDGRGGAKLIQGPREFRHALSTVVNGLIARGFVILGIWEDDTDADPDAKPGTWRHFQYILPPWLVLWAVYRPRSPIATCGG